MLLWLVFLTTIFLAMGVVGVDVSLWHAERRTAQNDSDSTAFAGGRELFNRTNTADITARAVAVAHEWGDRNGINPSIFTNGTPEVSTECWGSPAFDGLPDGVTVDLSDQASSLFSEAWDLITPDVGAHAKVCIGSPVTAHGMLPFAIPINTSPCFDDGAPLFGADCDVAVRAPAGSSGETGPLRLYNDGSLNCSSASVGGTNATFISEIAYGADTTCAVAPAGVSASACQVYTSSIGSCVWQLTGNRASAIIEGLQTRLALEGQSAAPYNCDALYPDATLGGVADGVDQWWEALNPVGEDIYNVIPGPGVVFERRDCTSPRVVTLILIDQFAAGGQGPYLIRGFAGFIIKGCYDYDDRTDTVVAYNQRCVTENAKVPNPTGEPRLNNTGHIYLEGKFINYVDVGKQGGALNEFGRMSLFLVE